jgi:hypothetical protein
MKNIIFLALILAFVNCTTFLEKERGLVPLTWSNCDPSLNDMTILSIMADSQPHKGSNNFRLNAVANTYLDFSRIDVTTFYLGSKVDYRYFEYKEEYESGD